MKRKKAARDVHSYTALCWSFYPRGCFILFLKKLCFFCEVEPLSGCGLMNKLNKHSLHPAMTRAPMTEASEKGRRQQKRQQRWRTASSIVDSSITYPNEYSACAALCQSARHDSKAVIDRRLRRRCCHLGSYF